MLNPFDSPKLLLSRANIHCDELKTRFHAFINDCKSRIVTDIDPQSGLDTPKIVLDRPFPEELSVVAFDILSNLRSALDQAVYSACEVIGIDKITSTKFPFGDTAFDAEGDAIRRCKTAPTQLRVFLLSYRPYLGGNDALWAMNKMRNTQIHRLLTPHTLAVGGVTITGATIVATGDEGIVLSAPKWDSAKQEIVLLSGAKMEGNYKIEASVDVVIGDTPILGGKPAIAVFNHLRSEVARIVRGIEAEAIRLFAGKPYEIR